MRVSVVIPVRNMASMLESQLGSLLAQEIDEPFEVLVADNGSSDHLPEVVERWSARMPNLRMIDASRLSGINHARNAGARAALGELLLFCDADDEVESRWVAGMVDALAHADAAGGTIRLFDEATGAWGTPTTPARLTTTELPRSPIGACCAVLRAVWRAVGEFDEDMSGGAGDETEFFWRLQSKGYRLAIAPDAVVRYRTTADAKQARRKEYRGARERVRLLRRFGLQPPPRDALRREVRAWGALVRDAPIAVAKPAARDAFARKVAKAAGRTVGLVRYRNEVQRFDPPPVRTDQDSLRT